MDNKLKNMTFDADDWQCIYTCVYRELQRQLKKSKHDQLTDYSFSRWKELLSKIKAHGELCQIS